MGQKLTIYHTTLSFSTELITNAPLYNGCGSTLQLDMFGGQQAVIKKPKTGKYAYTVYNEIRILKILGAHQNIIPLLDHNYTPPYLVLHYAKLGDIYYFMYKHYSYFMNNTELHENFLLASVHQIINALSFCHSNNVCHFDIKAENIFLEIQSDGKLRVYLSDFGLAEYIEKGKLVKKKKGTVSYMAPELFEDILYNPYNADVWSLGILIYFMRNIVNLFECGPTCKDPNYKIFLERGINTFLRDSDCFSELARQAIIYEPTKRIDLKNIFLAPLSRSVLTCLLSFL